VYVVDYNNRTQKFTADGTFITKWGDEGKNEGEFNIPLGIATDSQNNVYVLDSGNYRIQKFTNDGKFITSWGTQFSGEGQFDYVVSDIATDSSGNVYVSDYGNDRIQVFAPSK
jgi:tripartite motif-containing protein 71